LFGGLFRRHTLESSRARGLSKDKGPSATTGHFSNTDSRRLRGLAVAPTNHSEVFQGASLWSKIKDKNPTIPSCEKRGSRWFRKKIHNCLGTLKPPWDPLTLLMLLKLNREINKTKSHPASSTVTPQLAEVPLSARGGQFPHWSPLERGRTIS